MIQGISIVSKNLIKVMLSTREDLDGFITIFTTLDKDKAAKTLFEKEVLIEYNQRDNAELVELITDTDFTYHDVENILSHLSKHGMKVTNGIIANALLSAYNLSLKCVDIAFSIFDSCPQLNIRVKKNAFMIKFMNENYLDFDSQSSKAFIKSLKDGEGCVVGKDVVDIIVHSEIHQVISSIIESLIKCQLLEKQEEKNFKKRLRQLAFKDQAFTEYSSIKNISKYPHNHPFKKHETFTKGIENILYDFIKNSEDSNVIIEQLNRLNLEITPDVPKIITKTIDRLIKFY